MFRFGLTFLLFFILAAPAAASVELALAGKEPVLLDEVYLRDGVSFLAVDEVLPALGLSGSWRSVEHIYRIKSRLGRAVISPGSRYLRVEGRFIPLAHPPRFIDGRLRISEDFVTGQLQELTGREIYYRNLNPSANLAEEENPIDRLFAFFLRQKKPASGPAFGGVVLDPGHGGQDTGALGEGGVKEKDLALQIARRLEKQLKMRLGVPVYLSRDSDYALTPVDRFEPATRPGVDTLLLLHVQSSYGSGVKGVTLIVRPREEYEGGVVPAGEGQSILLARSLAESLRGAGFAVAGILQAPLLPLGRGNLPTVLIELGFLSNPDDLETLQDVGKQERLALALFEGLKLFTEKQKETGY